ncbi:MAG: major capsid family protein, partial [Pseudomonadota bacterium]
MAASTAQLHYIAPRHAEKAVYRPTNDGVKQFASFKKIGYGLDERRAYQMYKACFGLDNLPGNITTPSIPTFIQFLQAWLPGNVEVITAARKADILLGVMTAGSWSDEEIVQKISERLGVVVPYSDFGNSPISSWNLNAEKRHIVRFEAAIRVGTLEEDRAAAMQIAAGAERRDAAGTGLEIARNKVAFFGFNGGNNQTYGLLNDPNLPAYVGVPNGGSGFSQWATKTFEEIVKD